jgi:hypothetical protein
MTTPADQAGPALDARVGREVMGWSIEKDDSNNYTQRDPTWFTDEVRPLLKFSTDDAAALAVVERMLDLGYSWSCHGGKTQSSPRQFVVGFADWRENVLAGPIRHGQAETFELAVCRAALAAVGEGASDG